MKEVTVVMREKEKERERKQVRVTQAHTCSFDPCETASKRVAPITVQQPRLTFLAQKELPADFVHADTTGKMLSR